MPTEMVSMRFCTGSLLVIGAIGLSFAEESHVGLVHDPESGEDAAEDEQQGEDGFCTERSVQIEACREAKGDSPPHCDSHGAQISNRKIHFFLFSIVHYPMPRVIAIHAYY